MTAQVTELAPFAVISSRSWSDVLEAQVDHSWRPDEWDVERSLFTGEPDNPFTKTYICRIDGCVGVVEVSNGLCAGCRGALRHSSESAADWEATYVVGYRRSHTLDPADMDRDEIPFYARATVGKLGRNQFSLAAVSPAVRVEVLTGLQARDCEQVVLSPATVRRMVHLFPAGLTSVLDLDEVFVAGLPAELGGLLRSIQTAIQRLYGAFHGVDFTEEDVWNPALVGLRSAPNRDYIAAFGSIDFRTIEQPWLRELLKQYGRAVRPSATELNRAVTTAALASRVLASRPHGHDPALLGLADMSAIVDGFRLAARPDGSPYSRSHRIALLGQWRRATEFCRAAGLMDHVPGTFTINPRYHRIHHAAASEDALGRAIPEHVIAQLDAHLHLLPRISSYHHGGWSADDFGRMYTVIYQLLRDTGRRPNEIVSLRRSCLEWVEGKPTLIWDNHKRRRLGRRLPIHNDTATVITDWLVCRNSLPATPGAEEWLFPTAGARNRPRNGHVTSGHFASKVFRLWVDSIPELLDVGLTPAGNARTIAQSELTAYGLRHAYAQRHADNGTRVDVLCELMDHRSVETTMGYYTVTLKRKREAIEAVAGLAFDRHGNAAPATNALVYERDSVSVPFGNCTEPSNIKAGGKHCPIRYQCSGCSFYRPDPSYLHAIEEHVGSLRADRETAAATDAAGWVIDNLQEQIDAFATVATAMREAIVELPQHTQDTLEEASQVLRRDRAATSVFIPLLSVHDRPRHV